MKLGYNTYDRVEWRFLSGMMAKMGFTTNLINLLMKCVSSISYSVNINGKGGHFFKPIRGLCQGDPLSPFLFLISSEGLSSLMRSAIQERHSKG